MVVSDLEFSLALSPFLNRKLLEKHLSLIFRRINALPDYARNLHSAQRLEK